MGIGKQITPNSILEGNKTTYRVLGLSSVFFGLENFFVLPEAT
jgi:hypothetical protein